MLYSAVFTLFLSFVFAGCTSSDTGLTELNITPDTHTRFQISGTSSHASLTCNDCHGSFDTFKEYTCTDCHAHEQTVTDANHSSVADYSYVSTACYGCHPDGTASGVDHAAIFLIGSGTKHEAAACADCHVDSTNRAVVDCTSASCHPEGTMDSAHSGVLSGADGYLWTTNDCLACHSTPSVFRVRSHNNCVRHEGARCRTCHSSELTGKPFQASDFDRSSCTACHGNRGSNCNDD